MRSQARWIAGCALATALAGGRASAMRETPVQQSDHAAKRDVDTHHLFTPPASQTQWKARRKELREQLMLHTGLWPEPKRTPLKPVVTGHIEGDGYTVESVAIETFPGFRLCGSLYRPRGRKGPFPAIANPHGHWPNGRLQVEPDVPKAPPAPGAQGQGKANLPAIGANLARQGFVVFAYDMVGYNDTDQASHNLPGSAEAWGHGVSLLGLQTWNSLRVVDYLCSLPDVDKARIGATGASGGGTQTFLLAALDDRIKVSVPVNMVSAHMQGGCLCENGPALRIGTDNVEIAALFAPKPQLLVACTGDWTANVPTEEWPALRSVYSLYGAADRTAYVQLNYGHNYNIESREAMYAWFGRWLLGDENRDHFREAPLSFDTAAMRTWRSGVAKPTSGPQGNAAVLRALIERSEAQAPAPPTDAAALAAYRKRMAPAFRRLLSLPEPAPTSAGRTAGGAVLLVTEAGSAAEAAGVVADIRAKRGNAATELLELPAVAATAADLWGAYSLCYNRTPAAEAAIRIIRAASDLRSHTGKRVRVVALRGAGPAALLARAASPDIAECAADLQGADGSYASALRGSYVPCLQQIGGLPAAVAASGGKLSLGGAEGLDWLDRLAPLLCGSLKRTAAPLTAADVAR